MEFRLTYEGALKGATQKNKRAKHKHEIRRYFHPQLRRLWETHPVLKDRKTDGPNVEEPESWIDFRARKHPLGNYNFVPLVTRDLHVTCEIDVLFLRPDPPGDVLRSGDIDNRLKTLFDAFSCPTDIENLKDYQEPDECERPFFCLVEDDSMISRLSVDTDMLLESVNGAYDNSMARLVIGVTVTPYIATWGNISF